MSIINKVRIICSVKTNNINWIQLEKFPNHNSSSCLNITSGIKLFVLSLMFLFFNVSPAYCGNEQNAAQDSSNEYIFISDTQNLMEVEYLWNVENHNKRVRKLMFDDITRKNPEAVFHMGDMVGEAYLEYDWAPIDEFNKALKQKDIHMYPVMGNHELIAMPERGEKNFQKRFPEHSRTGYLVRIDSLAVLLLNSNFGNMNDDEIKKQNNWYNEQLEELENNPEVDLIVVGTHYSPFTNSTRVSTSQNVRDFFLPGYLKTNKAKLFFSGHTHAFEHFIEEGKHFFVIGGGGGPQQPLLSADEARHEDHFISEGKYRRFHYISLIKDHEGYSLNVIMADKDYEKLENAYNVRIK